MTLQARQNVFFNEQSLGTRNHVFTTLGLKYPLKKVHPQWAFSMAIANDFTTKFGKDCHLWNAALLSLQARQNATLEQGVQANVSHVSQDHTASTAPSASYSMDSFQTTTAEMTKSER